ncbi:hypothetical protein [Nocardioides sp. GY 10127]|uniref:hypothetical protein n=1 Tax=Nocardioides sp. GY 10127 TaxID=2569762 RepID=UPI0010A8ED7A|nr:hypothetical protein [Nocardioides sp. GY 10127]TIC81659.1 hypothetical protein E8D37_10680 [Nocardioides sp. GY 10127]
MLLLAVVVLTAFIALVVLVTRLRLRGRSAATWWLLVHTVLGLLGVVLWLAFVLLSADTLPYRDLVGIVAVGCFWFTSLAGLMLLSRKRRVGATRRSGGRRAERRTEGRALAIFGHVGVLLASGALTVTYALALV